ncbi:hypothetical protein AcW1_006418 [Taiwanofungus camphoratus]|nr:hypothetical protein AcV5_009004 [Antrodia cinnamomea]KAI0924251.1 hypothetical protein AcW2_005181 [Antrodia cinnamomea]KAI0954563.1 hypothetical protein AcW1_006418 [Antrodia cinnamomea]
MAKKRKETPQFATLHDFFAKSDGSRANKKPKIKKKARSDERKAKSVKRPPSEDIIVIDSDGEVVEMSVPRNGRSRGTSQDEEIEFVETNDVKPNVSRLHAKRVEGQRDGPSTRLFVEGSVYTLRQEGDLCPSFGDLVRGDTPFGEPSALLRSNTPQTLADAREMSPFGVPSLLLPPTSMSQCAPRASVHILNASSGVNDVVPSTSSDPTSNTNPIEIVQARIASQEFIAGRDIQSTPFQAPIDLDAAVVEEQLFQLRDEDWATGDDEMDIINLDGPAELEDEEVGIDLTLDDMPPPSTEGEGDVGTCPLCTKLLTGLSNEEIHQHVNDCIDSGVHPNSSDIKSLISQPSATSSSKALRPLSSLQTPHAHSTPPPPIKKEDNLSSRGCGNNSSVFSLLMSSHKENEAWKEATVAEDRNFRPTKGNGGRRKAPFYKVMQGMPIAVDAFRYGAIPGVTAYFLTHAHSDHYTNLSSNWKSGPIYCSEGTANLIIHMLAVDPKWVHALPMDVATTIPDTGGVRVTPIEANHCPGSCLFLFEGPQTVNAGDSAFKSPFVGSLRTFRYLHCGDFRASPQHVMHPAIKGKKLDHVYLDTTYLDPKYCFPPQPQVIGACAELARRIVNGESLRDDEGASKANKTRTMDSWLTVKDRPDDKEIIQQGRVLVVVGTYSIGKERIVKAIAQELKTKVYCDSRKAAILRCQADPELHALLTKDPIEAGIHLVPLGVIASDRLKDYVERFKGHYKKAVGFRPTGWTYSAPAGTDMLPSIATVISRSQSRTFTHAHLSPMKNSTAALQVYGVPYSEHSSFFELTCFALSLDWVKMIATVNVGSENSRRKMAKWIERWEAERKKRGKGEVVNCRAQDYW